MLIAAILISSQMMFTGVTGFVPSKKDSALIRVIAPDGRRPKGVELSQLQIPSHVAYVMFDIDDHQAGREPDFTVMRNGRVYGVCLINGEYLSVSGTFVRQDLTLPTPPQQKPKHMPTSSDATSLHWLFNYCRAEAGAPVPLDTKLLRPDPLENYPQGVDRVALRMDLEYGKFAVEPTSFEPGVTFVVSADGNSCQELARAASVTLESDADPEVLIIHSTPFTGKADHEDLRLSRKKSKGPLKVLIGNEPVALLRFSADFINPPKNTDKEPVAHQMDMSPHLFLMNRLMVPGSEPVAMPRRMYQNERCVDGVVQSTGIGGPIGGADGCNPPFMPHADPGDPPVCRR